MNKPRVSIITTCWNGESFINRFFDSILNQTYSKLELIFVNNGSVDKTGKIAESYRRKLQEKGVIFKYIYLEKNVFASGGYNEGLKHFTGDYLIWVDSDDIMYPNHIEEKIRFLEQNKGYAWAVCKCRIVDEKQPDVGIGELEISHANKAENLFERYIKRENIYFTGLGFIVRSSAFLDVNPTRSIFISKPGANWQLLLPIAYKYDCAYIDLTLGDYLVRQDSESRVDQTRDILETNIIFEKILNETIEKIHPENKQYYLNMITNIFIKEKLVVAYKLKDKALLEQQYQLIKTKNILTNKDKIIYFRSKYSTLDYIFKIISKIRNEIKKITRR